MGYIWLSFSYKGKNQGCCNVHADSREEALEICKELGIVPDYDDIAAFAIKEPELPLNIFVNSEALKKEGYKSSKDLGICDECFRRNEI